MGAVSAVWEFLTSGGVFFKGPATGFGTKFANCLKRTSKDFAAGIEEIRRENARSRESGRRIVASRMAWRYSNVTKPAGSPVSS